MNTVLVDEMLVGGSGANGVVTIRSGGSLHLGAPDRLTNLTIGKGRTNTGSTFAGTVDLTNATIVAYLDHVIIGEKDTNPGGQLGTLTFSDHSDNVINANTIVIGGIRSTGRLNYGGGRFTAASIAQGAGTAIFNWTGGRLSVESFGAAGKSFDLKNTGTGTLAPGPSIGATQIHGAYNQGAFATTEIQIAGTTPGVGYDQVNIAGVATLAGRLNLESTDGFVPAIGDSFDVVTFSSRSGQFDFLDPLALPADRAFQVDYSSPTKVVIRIVAPTPKSYTSNAASGVWASRTNWSGNSVPDTLSATTVRNTTQQVHELEVRSSTTVRSVDISGNPGAMEVTIQPGVTLAAASDVTIRSGGFIELNGGKLQGRNVSLLGGSLSGVGTVQVHDTFVNEGVLTPGSPKGVLNVVGNYSQANTARLVIDLGGPVPGSDHDQLNISGTATLDGTLDIQIADGFSPDVGDTFEILTYGDHIGEFGRINGLDLGDNLRLAPRFTSQALLLTASLLLVSDLTGNGFVDFEDLTVLLANWNKQVGSELGNLVNPDATPVNFEDLTVLLADWTGPGPAASPQAALGTQAVPEPSSFVLAAIAFLVLGWRVPRRSRPVA